MRGAGWRSTMRAIGDSHAGQFGSPPGPGCSRSSASSPELCSGSSNGPRLSSFTVSPRQRLHERYPGQPNHRYRALPRRVSHPGTEGLPELELARRPVAPFARGTRRIRAPVERVGCQRMVRDLARQAGGGASCLRSDDRRTRCGHRASAQRICGAGCGRRQPRFHEELDFPTVGHQFLSRRRLGVEVEIVVSPDGVEVPLEAIAKAVDERTALLVTSHVFFSSGAIQDATALTHIAHATGASILLDAYQSNGQMEIDVETLGVDFLASGALKWLCGGPGLAYLYATRAGAALGPRSGTLSRSGSDRSASRRAGRDH